MVRSRRGVASPFTMKYSVCAPDLSHRRIVLVDVVDVRAALEVKLKYLFERELPSLTARPSSRDCRCRPHSASMLDDDKFLPVESHSCSLMVKYLGLLRRRVVAAGRSCSRPSTYATSSSGVAGRVRGGHRERVRCPPSCRSPHRSRRSRRNRRARRCPNRPYRPRNCTPRSRPARADTSRPLTGVAIVAVGRLLVDLERERTDRHTVVQEVAQVLRAGRRGRRLRARRHRRSST